MSKHKPSVTGRGCVFAAGLLLLLGAMPTTTLGALWTPADIETVAWYDATDTHTTIPVSGTISQWLDKGSSTNELTLSGADGMETGTRTINDLNVMNGAGRAHFSTGNFPLPGSGNISIFMVSAIDLVNAGDDCAFALIASYNGNVWLTLAPGTNTQFTGKIVTKNFGGLSLALTGGPYDGRTNIFNTVLDHTATNLSVYVDGVNKGSTAYPTKLFSPVQFRLFRGTAGSKYRGAPDGAIAEVVLVEDCSSGTRQRLEGYLAHKWGLEGNLPSGHPYKSAPPITGATGALLVVK